MSKHKKKKTKDPIESGDWRLLSSATLANSFAAVYRDGPPHEAGTHVRVSTSAWGPDNEEIHFDAPSFPAMCMSLAIRGRQDVLRLKKLLVFRQLPSHKGLMKSVAGENTPLLFDMFEASIVTATFCYAALETFSNYYLGLRLKEPVKLRRNNAELIVSPEDVPRRASLEEKLGVILPTVLSAKSPKSLAVWGRFKRIKAVRDAAVHLKSGDVLYAGPKFLDAANERPLLSAFFRDDIADFPQYVIEMIEHFGPPREGSQWIAHVKRRLEAEIDG